MRRASYAVRSPRSSGPTAATRLSRRPAAVGRVASATQRQWSGCPTRWSTRAMEPPRTATSRSLAGPGRRSATSRAALSSSRSGIGRPFSGRFLARARAPRSRSDSISRTSPSSAWSGSAAALSASGRPSWKTSSSGSANPVSARSWSRASARLGSAKPSRASCPPAVVARVVTDSPPLEARQVAVELELGHLATVVLPLRPLVAQKEVEDVLAQRLGDELAALHHLERAAERERQRIDAHGPSLGVGEVPDVVLGLRRDLISLF